MKRFGIDVRSGWRVMRRNLSFTAVVLLSIGFSIGANTLVFTICHSLLFRTLPFIGSIDNLVFVREVLRSNQMAAFSLPDYDELQKSQTTFVSLAAFRTSQFGASNVPGARPVAGASVSDQIFTTLGVRPLQGRAFRTDEYQEGRERVFIASHSFWAMYFSADPNAIGRSVLINAEPFVLVGVMPEGFSFPDHDTEIWIPLAPTPADTRDFHNLQVIGRLKPHISASMAQTETEAFLRNTRARRHSTSGPKTAVVIPLREEVLGEAMGALPFLTASVILVLAIACVNVAALQYTRTQSRSEEIATRFAVGATRGQVCQQLLLESLTLGICGGLLGVGIAYAGLAILVHSLPPSMPSFIDLTIDRSVLLFSAAASILSSVLFGLGPALRGTALNPHDALKHGLSLTPAKRVRRTCAVSAVVQIALALLLSTGSAIAVHRLLGFYRVDAGVEVRDRFVATVSPVESSFPDSASRRGFFFLLLQRLAQLPGTRAIAIVWRLPMSEAAVRSSYSVAEGALSDDINQSAIYYVCSPGYFETVGIRSLAGRTFDTTDSDPQSKSAIISRELAGRLWPTPSAAIGNTLLLPTGDHAIVGVVEDVRHFGLAREISPAIYVPFAQDVPPTVHLVIKGELPAKVYSQEIARALGPLDGRATVSEVRPFSELRNEKLMVPRILGIMLPCFAGCAIAMAFIGVYAVVSYSTTQRKREIAIRRALGASNPTVAKLVLLEAARIGMAGVAIGSCLLAVVVRAMSSALPGVQLLSASRIAAIACAMLAVVILAGAIPAAKAVRTDPATDLKCN